MEKRRQDSSAPRVPGLEVVAPGQLTARRPRRSPGATRFRWLLPAALVLAVAGAIRFGHQVASRRAGSFAVPTAAVRSGVIEKTVRLTGATVAPDSVMLRAPYLRGRRSGGSSDFGLTLQELANPGARVRKGDLVAAFDRLSMQNRLDNYSAARVDRELRLKSLLAELDLKREAYRQKIRIAKARMDKAALDLKTAPVRSAIEATVLRLAYEEAQAAYQALLVQHRFIEAGERADVRMAELEFEEAQVEERRAAANVERMIGRAPVAGIVTPIEVFRGSGFDEIQVGDQLRRGQPYMQIVNPASIVVEASVNQVDIECVRIGARAHVHFDAYPDLELSARVFAVGALARSRGWRSNYVAEASVFLRLDRMDLRLIPNLTVSADIVVESEHSVRIVPLESIFHGSDGQPFVYVRTSSGWDVRDLELGIANHVEVAVGSGVRPGETVARSAPVV